MARHEGPPFLAGRLALEESQYVISRYRDCNANLRTRLIRIIHRAGLKPWPKLFHNLRSTRQTELAEKYPIHVVCAWLGNSRAVAQEHYLQVPDAHFAQAAQVPPVAQKAARSGAALASMVMNSGKGRNENRSEIPSDSASCDAVQNQPVTPTGSEQPAEMPEKQGIPAERGTESGTVGDNPASNRQRADSDLADVVKAWPDLPGPIKAGILAMVKAARG